jgi:hypothetical protein
MPINAAIVFPNLSLAIHTCTNGFLTDSDDISSPPPTISPVVTKPFSF